MFFFFLSFMMEATKNASEAGKGSDGESVRVSARCRVTGARPGPPAWATPPLGAMSGWRQPARRLRASAGIFTKQPHADTDGGVCVCLMQTHIVRRYLLRVTDSSQFADWTFSLITDTHSDLY